METIADDLLDSASSKAPPSASMDAMASTSSAALASGGGSEPSPLSEQKNAFLQNTGLLPCWFVKDRRKRGSGDLPSPTLTILARRFPGRECNRPRTCREERTFSMKDSRKGSKNTKPRSQLPTRRAFARGITNSCLDLARNKEAALAAFTASLNPSALRQAAASWAAIQGRRVNNLESRRLRPKLRESSVWFDLR